MQLRSILSHFSALVPAIRPRYGRSKFEAPQISSQVSPYGILPRPSTKTFPLARCTAHCLTRAFATTNQVLLAQELAAKFLRLINLKAEIPTTKTAIRPWVAEMLNKGYGKFPPPLEEGSGMKPLWLTSMPPADLEKGQGAGAMSKPANHKVKRAHCSVEHPCLLITAALGHARHLLQ